MEACSLRRRHDGSERDPAQAGIERFIGSEHLEPGSLHVRTRGNAAAGTTFIRRYRRAPRPARSRTSR